MIAASVKECQGNHFRVVILQNELRVSIDHEGIHHGIVNKTSDLTGQRPAGE
jgi:hypothetical protein